MKVLEIAGWPGIGKTTLIVALLPLLRATGLTVSTIIHTHQGFDMDRPGKDSHRHREAGAHEVLVASSHRWALLHDTTTNDLSLCDLLTRLEPASLVLVEGFKSHPFPKLEVWRSAHGKLPLSDGDPGVIAVATDSGVDIGPRVMLPLNEPPVIAAWIQTRILDG